MTRLLVIGSVLACMVATIVAADYVPRTWVASGDYNTHVTNYRPECEHVLKRYMPNERRQHFKSYNEYLAMISALNACNDHATPGLVRSWVWIPIPNGR